VRLRILFQDLKVLAQDRFIELRRLLRVRVTPVFLLDAEVL
jgi:hypothetical protein